MFGFNREKRLKAVKRDLIDLGVVLQRLEGIPCQRVRQWPRLTGPLRHYISTLLLMGEPLAQARQRVAKGGLIPWSARSDLLELLNDLQALANMNWERPRGGVDKGRRDPGLIRRLKRLTSRLRRDVERLKEPDTPFQKCLKKLMRRSRIPTYSLAQLADVNLRHLQRLRNGERRRPGRDLAVRLAAAMAENSQAISDKDVKKLIESAGYTVPRRLPTNPGRGM